MQTNKSEANHTSPLGVKQILEISVIFLPECIHKRRGIFENRWLCNPVERPVPWEGM